MNDLIIQSPQAVLGRTTPLILCLHGVGSNAEDLRPLASHLAQRQPQSWVVSVQSPDRSDMGGGWQWFSVRGITDANRPERIAATMPRFVQTVEQWQRASGSDAAHTTLVGFSQGAIMALESTQLEQPLAARVVAMAGRFGSAPARRSTGTRIHLLHGQSDAIVPAQASVLAHSQLTELGADATLDLFTGLGHGIDGRMVARLDARLATA